MGPIIHVMEKVALLHEYLIMTKVYRGALFVHKFVEVVSCIWWTITFT